MGSGAAYLFAIIFFVIALNFYFLFFRMRRGNKRKRTDRIAVEEARQAVWREKEVARRIEREQDDALERVKLRNETLALYEIVRQRHAQKDNHESIERYGDPEQELQQENSEYEHIGWGSFYKDNAPNKPDSKPLDILWSDE